MRDAGDFLAGALIGGLAGLVAGLLLAPAPGEETRARLARTGSNVKEQVAGVAGTVDRATHDLIRTLRARLPRTNEVQQVLDDVAREAAPSLDT